MGRFDLIEVTTWAGLTVFILLVLPTKSCLNIKKNLLYTTYTD